MLSPSLVTWSLQLRYLIFNLGLLNGRRKCLDEPQTGLVSFICFSRALNSLLIHFQFIQTLCSLLYKRQCPKRETGLRCPAVKSADS